jgi:hypothetical protein
MSLPKIEEAPYFVGGPLHGRLVHETMRAFPLLQLIVNNENVLYMRTMFYRLHGQSFFFYAQVGEPVDRTTSMLWHALRAEKGLSGDHI